VADSKPLFDYLDKKQQVRAIAACTNTNGSRQPLCNAPSLVHESIGAQANVRLEKPPSRSAEDKLRDLIAQDHGAMPARTHSLAHAHSPSPFTVHRSPCLFARSNVRRRPKGEVYSRGKGAGREV
jgi:hypothetical protein